MRVVLVEDSDRIRHQLRRLMDTLPDVRVIDEAGSEREAIAVVCQHRPDVVLLGLNLKNGNGNSNGSGNSHELDTTQSYGNGGMRVLEAVRSAGVTAKVFVLTTHPASASREMCLAMGADDYFEKTSDMPRLVAVLRKMNQVALESQAKVERTARRTGSFWAMLPIAFAVVVALLMAPAYGATNTNTLQATVNVSSSCTVTGSTMNFGVAIDPIATAVPLNASSALSVRCTNTTPYAIALDAGLNAGGATNFSARKIQNGAYTLGYQLYTDSGRTSVWGNGTGSSTSSGTGTGSTQSVSIYGQLPDLTGAVPGTYTDTVTVTITY